MSSILHEWSAIPVGDGSEMEVFLARPADGHDRHRGVLVLQEIWGVNAHIRDVCDRFARLGYTALAPDLFHRSAPRFEAPYSDRSGFEHLRAMTEAGLEADLVASHQAMLELLSASTNDPRIGACGFCMGGRAAFVANAKLPLSAAACFYGGGIAGRLELAPAQQGALLLLWGGRDGFITKEQRRATADALEAAGKPFTEVNVSHADHGFFCDQRASYDAEAAREAWGLVTAFFEAKLLGSP